MPMSQETARGSAVIGALLLLFTLISVICGGVAMGKLTSPAATTIGVWGLYYIIPGALCIATWYQKQPSLLAVTLGTHILGIILGIVGMSIAAAFWTLLNLVDTKCYNTNTVFTGGVDSCICKFSVNSDTVRYDASCDVLESVRDPTAAVTFVFAFFAIVSFVGSIFGCIGTCCAPREPVVVVASTFPAHTNTVVVTNQQAHFAQPGGQINQPPYVQQPYGQQPYSQQPYGQPPAYAPQPGQDQIPAKR